MKIQFNKKKFQVIPKPDSDSYTTHDDIDHQSNDNEAIFI